MPSYIRLFAQDLDAAAGELQVAATSLAHASPGIRFPGETPPGFAAKLPIVLSARQAPWWHGMGFNGCCGLARRRGPQKLLPAGAAATNGALADIGSTAAAEFAHESLFHGPFGTPIIARLLARSGLMPPPSSSSSSSPAKRRDVQKRRPVWSAVD